MSENEAIPNRVAQYLREVESHMSSPSTQKTEVLQNLEAQVLDELEKRAGRNPSVADVEAVIAEMDPPRSYGDGGAVVDVTNGVRNAAYADGWKNAACGIVSILLAILNGLGLCGLSFSLIFQRPQFAQMLSDFCAAAPLPLPTRVALAIPNSMVVLCTVLLLALLVRKEFIRRKIVPLVLNIVWFITQMAFSFLLYWALIAPISGIVEEQGAGKAEHGSVATNREPKLENTVDDFLKSCAASNATSRQEMVAAKAAGSSVETVRSLDVGEKKPAVAEGLPSATNKVNGFVFIDGRYIDAPYRVESHEGWILINDIKVEHVTEWPIQVESPEKPIIPADVLKNAKSFDDLVIPGEGDAWHGRMARWIARNIPDQMAERKRFYESLPFVREVVVLDAASIRIVLKNGEVQEFVFEGLPPAPTKDEILKRIESQREDFEEELARGNTIFFYATGHELSIGPAKAAADLKLMTDVLGSNRATAEKVRILQRMEVLPEVEGQDEQVTLSVTNFHSSARLAQRIDELIKTSAVQPRELADVPEQSPGDRAEWERQEIDRRMQESQRSGDTTGGQ